MKLCISPGRWRMTGLLALGGVQMMMTSACKADETWLPLYVGTYTENRKEGIFLLHLNPKTGELVKIGAYAAGENPSFLAIHPNHKFLYAVNETVRTNGQSTGEVSAYKIDESGALIRINGQVSRGEAPCHIIIDKAGKNVLVANYGTGSVAVLPVAADGSLKPVSGFSQHTGKSVDAGRQEGPHGHSINLDSANKWAYGADLGTDKVYIYRYDGAAGTITPSEPPSVSVAPGSGPRHFAIHPSEKFAYVINEMLSTVTAFSLDTTTGRLKNLKTVSTLPEGYKGNTSCAEVRVHPNGKFLYGSNRGHDSIAAFRIDAATGLLTPIGQFPTGGKTPRNFTIDPTGQFLIAANQDSNDITVLRIDGRSGKLLFTGNKISIPRPVCVRFLP